MPCVVAAWEVYRCIRGFGVVGHVSPVGEGSIDVTAASQPWRALRCSPTGVCATDPHCEAAKVVAGWRAEFGHSTSYSTLLPLSAKAYIMNRPMVYGTLMLFLLFMITANPSGTGENGREFADWLASGFDDAREFMGSFIGDEEADTNDLGEIPIPSVGPEADPDLLPQVEDPPPPVDDGDGSVQG